jgi:hypothetical protein
MGTSRDSHLAPWILAAAAAALVIFLAVLAGQGQTPPPTLSGEYPSYEAAHKALSASDADCELAVLVTADWCQHCPEAVKLVPVIATRAIVVVVDHDRQKVLVDRLGGEDRVPRVHLFIRRAGKFSLRILKGSAEIAAWAVRGPKPR